MIKKSRKQGNKALLDSDEIYGVLVKTSPEAVTVTDLTGKITRVSQQTLKLHGFKSAGELLGKNAFELISPEDREKAAQNLKKTLKHGIMRNLEYVLLKKDGSRFIGELNAALIKDSGGKPKAFIATTKDITERKKAEEALRDSESKYRNLIENSIEGIGISKGNRVIFANKTLLEIFGYKTLEEFTKIPLLEHVAPEYRNMILERMKKRKTGKAVPQRYEYRIIRKDGGVRDIEISTSELLIGSERYVQSTFQDMTERKKAEEDLRRVKEHLQTVLDGINEAIVVIDRNLRIVSHNKAFTRSLRRMRKNIVGKPCFKVIHGFMRPCRKCVVKDMFKRGRPSHDIHYHLAGGGRIFHEVKAYPIRDASGKINQSIYVFRDVTERETMYERIREANLRLEELNRMKSDFISIASHELRTPLAIIKGYVDVIRGGVLGEVNKRQREKLDAISNNIMHLDKMVGDILDLSIIDAGGLELKLRKTDLDKLASAVLDDFKFIAENKGVALRIKKMEGGVKVRADEGRLKQVLTNLLDNSIKFTPKGGEVMLVVGKTRKHAILRVEDTGIGIAKKNIKKIFKRFYQIDSSPGRMYKGVGLGLPICKRMVDLHEGSIEVESRINKGTTATIKLPL